MFVIKRVHYQPDQK
ncbi:hypothetical protein LI012_10970 [Caldibacillus thermoamylovorans]|nr:hypothetical protein [Bacillus sp. DFI.2.34]MCB7077336.1 hypothetical protein [Caldibacillus thermoamylovorans]